MALYKHANFLQLNQSAAFDQDALPPGLTLTTSGIYRCRNCGREIAANKGDPLPPQNHHQHPLPPRGGAMLPIQWQLIVAAA